jgi:hypothetical protein
VNVLRVKGCIFYMMLKWLGRNYVSVDLDRNTSNPEDGTRIFHQTSASTYDRVKIKAFAHKSIFPKCSTTRSI